MIEREDTEIEVSPAFAWILLLVNILSNALVPCWLMSNLSKEPHTRNSWRFLWIAVLTTPFVAYEYRKIRELGGNLFSVITPSYLKSNYLAAIHFCIEVFFIIQAVNFTSMTHAVMLVGLKFFILSLSKFWRKKIPHEFEKAGMILVVLGIILMLADSIFNYNYDTQPNSFISPVNYLRVTGDLFSVVGSAACAYLNETYTIPDDPKFLSLFFQNLFISFNFICFGYYFGGSELSFNEYNGVFGLFDAANFVTIFYVGIMLGFNLMITSVMLEQIYSLFILDIANSFGPLVTTLLYRLMHLEEVMAYTYLSFGFFVPGMILILSGNNASQNGEVKIDFVVYRPDRPDPKLKNTSNMIEMEDFGRSPRLNAQESRVNVDTSLG
jgi:hypothetical protein